MIPQRSWLPGISGFSKQDSKAVWAWWASMPFAVALGALAFSSHGFASDAAGTAASRPFETGSSQREYHAQLVSDPAEQSPPASRHNGSSQKDWATLLKLMVSGPERTELAANVGELLQRGDLTGAQQMLSAAVEAGTFAVAIVDSIRDPEVQRTLQAIARERRGASLETGVHTGDADVDGAEGSEPGDAAERERVRAEAALQELHAAQEQLTALREKEARASALEQALEQEKERTASATQDLDHARKQLAAMAEQVTRAADERDERVREVEAAKAALVDLTIRLRAAQEQLAILMESPAVTGASSADLERENDAADLAAREIAALKEQLVTLRTGQVDNSRLINSVAQEKSRADAVSQQLGTLQDQLSALRAREAKIQDELKQERENSASLTRRLVDTQRELASQTIRAASVAEAQGRLRQEKERTAAALREVDALKRQIADLGASAKFKPAALPVRTTPVPPSPGRAKPDRGADREDAVPQRQSRQAALPPQDKTRSRLPDEAAAQARRPSVLQKSGTEEAGRRSSGSLRSSAVSGKGAVTKLKRPSRVLARENSATEVLIPDLPASLRPAGELWLFF